MEKWFVTMKKADFQSISEKYHISPILARLIRNREVIGEEAIDFYLNGTIADLYDGMLMKDMDKAVEILSEKIRERAAIRIIGDYDIDGVNATYILQEGLAGLGADVDTDIPDRIRDGYGLNRNLIDRALEDGIDTIITCDNGIAAGEEILYGKERGLTVIVTDHHEIPFLDAGGEKEYLLPQADAVVDPHRPDCEYPFKGLCGAAVAYKLVEALYEVMQRDAEDVDYLMENVAIATVGDVMDLCGENRIFVKQGLEMLKRTRNEGLKALMECTNVPVDRLNAYHIGFVIGPCINAGGRLDTAKRALELLCAKNRRDAVMLAEDLKALNDSRKEMTEKGVEQAVKDLNKTLGYSGEDKIKATFNAPDGEDIDEQVNILDEELARYPDALGIASIDEDACKVQFDAAAENGIPVIALDSGNTYQGIQCTVKTNNTEAAKTVAYQLCNGIEDAGEVLLLASDSNSEAAKERLAGFQEEIKSEHPNVQIVDTIYCDQMDDLKKEIAEQKNAAKKAEEPEITADDLSDEDVILYYMEQHPNLKGMFGTNVTAVQLGLSALKEAEKTDEIVLTGFDAGEDQIEALKNGELEGLAVQNPFGIGYASVVAAARSILQTGNEALVDTGYVWVTNENMEDASIKNMLYK